MLIKLLWHTDLFSLLSLCSVILFTLDCFPLYAADLCDLFIHCQAKVTELGSLIQLPRITSPEAHSERTVKSRSSGWSLQMSAESQVPFHYRCKRESSVRIMWASCLITWTSVESFGCRRSYCVVHEQSLRLWKPCREEQGGGDVLRRCLENWQRLYPTWSAPRHFKDD